MNNYVFEKIREAEKHIDEARKLIRELAEQSDMYARVASKLFEGQAVGERYIGIPPTLGMGYGRDIVQVPRQLLEKCEAFMGGFEDDDEQEGVTVTLNTLRFFLGVNRGT